MGVMIEKPTQEDLEEAAWDGHDDFERVSKKADNDWRHGCTITAILKRLTDATFWRVVYRQSTDGEYNGIRENDYSLVQVKPVEVTTTKYLPVDG